MGTRGFLGFVVDGTEKIAYNHSDSYPEGLGLEVLQWLRPVMEQDGVDGLDGGARAILRATVQTLRVVDPNSEPTDEDIAHQLLRETQGNPRLILNAGVIEDASGFPMDSLFAEWGYLVDLDAGTFEVYQGFQREPHDKGRFADRTPRDAGYAPVALVQSWPLGELPADKDFVGAFRDEDEDGVS